MLDKAFARVREYAELTNSSVRIRILIAPNAQELHAVIWELLGSEFESNPALISTYQRLLFSRYLRLNPKPLRQSTGRLRSVLLAANPRKSKGQPLNVSDISVDDHLRRVVAQMESETNCAPSRDETRASHAS